MEQVDRRVVEWSESGERGNFCTMLPMYNDTLRGEGGMHDTAMLLGSPGS